MPFKRSKAIFAGGALVALALLVALGFNLRSSERASANPVSGFTQIDGGLFHTCGVTNSGGVKCWGTAFDADFIGFIYFGDGSNLPTNVAGWTSGVSRVASGLYHTCALMTSGSVSCLGKQYGTSPVAVPAFGSNVVSISAGWNYTCAVKSTGSVACYFTDGTPLATTGLTSGVTQVAAANGFHTCVLMTNTTVKCWGFNEHGQIGDGTTVPRPTAVTVSGLSNVTQISLGTFYSCALTVMGGVKCWGDGFGTTPVDLPGLTSGIAEISASVEHFCARTTTGGVKCRGNDPYGQLGNNFECGPVCLTPVVPAGLSSGVAHINTGHEHSCAILTTTQAKCWGFNGLGSVGDGTAALTRPVPVFVAQSFTKPTPTATPCPGVCPTATPVPTRPPADLDFGLGIDSNGNGIDDCRTFGIYLPATCNVQLGSTFDIRVYLNSYPSTIPNYQAFQATIAFEGVSAHNNWTFVWPHCLLPVTAPPFPTFTNGGCTTFGGLISTYTGVMARSAFTCTESGEASLVHGPADTLLYDYQSYYEPSSHVDELTINCGNFPLATPTPLGGTSTPHPVGGLAIDAGAEGSGSAAWWWPLVGGVVVALTCATAVFAVRKR